MYFKNERAFLAGIYTKKSPCELTVHKDFFIVSYPGRDSNPHERELTGFSYQLWLSPLPKLFWNLWSGLSLYLIPNDFET